MNKFYRKYRIIGNWTNILLMLTVLVPMLILSYYNHPSIADDFCYIDTVFKYSWLEAMNFYYTGWTGRYFGIFLNHSNPLLFHSITGFKVLPALLLLATVFSLYSLFRHLTPTLSRLAHLGFAGVVFFLLILKMGSTSEAFYWMAAFVTYTVPNILTLFWIVLVLRWYRQDTQSARIFVGALAGFLVFAAMGCGETNLLIMILLIGAWWVYRLAFHRKIDGFMVAMLVTAAFSCYLYFSSPGNQARMSGNPMSGDIIGSVLYSFKEIAVVGFGWVFKTPVIFFTILWLLVLSRLSEGARRYFSIPVWYAFLLFVGVLSAQVFVSFYGFGVELKPAPRVMNSVYFFFLIGWFYLAGVFFHHFGSKRIPLLSITTLRLSVVYGVLLISLVASFSRSLNVRTIYADLFYGKAAAFDKEMFGRYAMIQNSKENIVYIPPIKNRPLSIFYEDDIKEKTDPIFIWNRCLAGYFGKEAIYLKPTDSDPQ